MCRGYILRDTVGSDGGDDEGDCLLCCCVLWSGTSVFNSKGSSIFLMGLQAPLNCRYTPTRILTHDIPGDITVGI